MIKDNLNNCDKYKNLTDNIVQGLNWVKQADFTKLTDGKHILSDDIYINIQTYTTKSDALFEAHRDYIDIQYIISGSEKIGVEPYNNCISEIPYDKDKDIEFLNLNNTSDDNYTELAEGEFMILYPQDAHKPSITIDTPTEVRKAVVKVHI